MKSTAGLLSGLIVGGQVLDIVTTYIALSLVGISGEGNPVMRSIWAAGGWPLMIVVKAAWAAFAICFIRMAWRPNKLDAYGRAALLAVLALQVGVVARNTYIIWPVLGG